MTRCLSLRSGQNNVAKRQKGARYYKRPVKGVRPFLMASKSRTYLQERSKNLILIPELDIEQIQLTKLTRKSQKVIQWPQRPYLWKQ